MQFESISEFLHMGGYASYVWSSTAIVILVVLAVTIDSLTGEKRTLKKIKQELDRAEKINQARQKNQTQTEGS